LKRPGPESDYCLPSVDYCHRVTAQLQLNNNNNNYYYYYYFWGEFSCILCALTTFQQTTTVQICVAKRRRYVLRNASLSDFVVVRKCIYANLDSTA
jgi:hypothetical protein